jgi:S-methylmethionine-dependent homocysteine/selenocysteine methylase
METIHPSELPQLKGDLFLTDGGLETTLIFHRGIDLPGFAAFDLLKGRAGHRGDPALLRVVPRPCQRARHRVRPREPDLARKPEVGRGDHAELDEAEELDAGGPADLGTRYTALRERLPNLNVVGGCCGTDDRHVAQICAAWLQPAA